MTRAILEKLQQQVISIGSDPRRKLMVPTAGAVWRLWVVYNGTPSRTQNGLEAPTDAVKKSTLG